MSLEILILIGVWVIAALVVLKLVRQHLDIKRLKKVAKAKGDMVTEKNTDIGRLSVLFAQKESELVLLEDIDLDKTQKISDLEISLLDVNQRLSGYERLFPLDDELTLAEAAEYTGLSKSTLRGKIYKGKLRSRRVVDTENLINVVSRHDLKERESSGGI